MAFEAEELGRDAGEQSLLSAVSALALLRGEGGWDELIVNKKYKALRLYHGTLYVRTELVLRKQCVYVKSSFMYYYYV